MMVGGCSRMPKIKDIVKKYFKLTDLNSKVNPDEAVALGATIQSMQMMYYGS